MFTTKSLYRVLQEVTQMSVDLISHLTPQNIFNKFEWGEKKIIATEKPLSQFSLKPESNRKLVPKYV